jgi:hypothetical protein
VLFINGKVTETFSKGDRQCVRIEQEARNQDDELSILASGVVELPSKAT